MTKSQTVRSPIPSSLVGGRPDVVVIGSGAAGLAAALAARSAGAEVLLLERSSWLGGTTAISGGVVWVPGNDLMAEAGSAEPASDALDALDYLSNVEPSGDREMWAAFVGDAPRVARLIEERTPLRWSLLEDWPDYHSELAGGRRGGRSLWPCPVRMTPQTARLVQPGPEPSGTSDPGSSGEDPPSNDGVVFRGPVRGRVLVGALVAALGSLGVEMRTGARVRGLAADRGGVRGVTLDGEVIGARVVMATGGFQHDRELASEHLASGEIAPMGTPGCAGDGLRMVAPLGAELANMAQGWWMPGIRVDGEELDGSPYYRPLHSERARPGAVMVDRTGRRFVDEAQNYGDVGWAMQKQDGGGNSAIRPWLIFDAACRATSFIGPLAPGSTDPDWLVSAEKVSSLAAELGIEPAVLTETVERFNVNASDGEDPDFGRGSFYYDRWIGEHDAPHPTLAPLADPPYYAVPVSCGCMGTKGGPVTDPSGRVVSTTRAPIKGLYAAGNVAASIFPTSTPAGGATLGPALVFGTRAGEAAAGDA